MPIEDKINKYETELILGCQRNERKAQFEFYQLYAPKLLGIAYRFAADRDLANDLLQEAFIRIFKNIEKYRFDGPIGAWNRRILIHTSIDFMNKYKRLKFDDIHETQHLNELVESPMQLENLQCEDIIRHICLLPDGFRTVLNLYAIEGYSYAEISEMLGIKEVTVRTQYMRAKQKLSEVLINHSNIYVKKSV